MDVGMTFSSSSSSEKAADSSSSSKSASLFSGGANDSSFSSSSSLSSSSSTPSGSLQSANMQRTSGANLQHLRSALCDVMTLRCPSCKTPVDPFPDACSAVMCLNCGGHYCNCCFLGFSSGIMERDRALAHEHVARHNTSPEPEIHDAFLSTEIVNAGQKKHQQIQLEKCLALAMCSTEYGSNARHDVALALILCSTEVSDLGINLVQLWEAAELRAGIATSADSVSPVSNQKFAKGLSNTGKLLDSDINNRFKFSAKNLKGDLGRGRPAGAMAFAPVGDELDDFLGEVHNDQFNDFGSPGASIHPLGAKQPSSNPPIATKSGRRKVLVPKREAMKKLGAGGGGAEKTKTTAFGEGMELNAGNSQLPMGAKGPFGSSGRKETGFGAGSRGHLDGKKDSFQGASWSSSTPNDQTAAEDDARIRRQGSVNLANAIITNNSLAVNQILSSCKDKLDLDYVDPKHGHPLASLAILATQPLVAIKLLEMGADPLKRNSSGRSVLYIATESGIASVLRCIVRKHPNLDLNQPITTEIQRYCCIHVAARYNHGHIIRGLAKLKVNLDVEENEHGYTPLTLALVLGHEWAATELIRAGAKVRVAAMNGRTPMFVAAEKGLGEVIRLMVTKAGVDVDEPVVMPSGLRLMHVAAFHKQPHVVSQLISMGADINLLDDEGGYNPLTMAIIGTNVAAALELIEMGADVRVSSQSGRTPMYVAIEKGLTEVVRTLITKKGISVNERVTSEPSAARPLHVAVLHGQSHLIPFLISMGANVNEADQEKQCTPLIMATVLQDECAVRLLIRHGADATRVSREGRSATYIAAEKGHSGILRLLIEECGISVNAPTTNETNKGTPLHVAAMFDNVHTVSQLLSMGADVNAVDTLGRRPQDLAKEASSFAALYLLTWHSRNSSPENALHDPTEVATMDDDAMWERERSNSVEEGDTTHATATERTTLNSGEEARLYGAEVAAGSELDEGEEGGKSTARQSPYSRADPMGKIFPPERKKPGSEAQLKGAMLAQGGNLSLDATAVHNRDQEGNQINEEVNAAKLVPNIILPPRKGLWVGGGNNADPPSSPSFTSFSTSSLASSSTTTSSSTSTSGADAASITSDNSIMSPAFGEQQQSGSLFHFAIPRHSDSTTNDAASAASAMVHDGAEIRSQSFPTFNAGHTEGDILEENDQGWKLDKKVGKKVRSETSSPFQTTSTLPSSPVPPVSPTSHDESATKEALAQSSQENMDRI